MTYTREQLVALKNKLLELAEDALGEAMIGWAFDCQYELGERAAYISAASHVLALIEREGETPCTT